jgi:hypothetical protein
MNERKRRKRRGERERARAIQAQPVDEAINGGTGVTESLAGINTDERIRITA